MGADVRLQLGRDQAPGVLGVVGVAGHHTALAVDDGGAPVVGEVLGVDDALQVTGQHRGGVGARRELAVQHHRQCLRRFLQQARAGLALQAVREVHHPQVGPQRWEQRGEHERDQARADGEAARGHVGQRRLVGGG